MVRSATMAAATSSTDHLTSLRYLSLIVAYLLAASVINVEGHQYKVGDLRCWGPPSSSNPHVYSSWSLNHRFKIGDSLLFLYPPSEDSVVQLSKDQFDACDVSSPILKLRDGNSLFNLTSAGVLYLASGDAARCGKYQKLAVSVLFANGSSADPETTAPAASPSSSFPMVFGPSGSNSGPASAIAGSWIVGLMAAAIASF